MKTSEPVKVPLIAFCYKCRAIIDARKIGFLKRCPKCKSKRIDTWGVEITKE